MYSAVKTTPVTVMQLYTSNYSNEEEIKQLAAGIYLELQRLPQTCWLKQSVKHNILKTLNKFHLSDPGISQRK